MIGSAISFYFSLLSLGELIRWATIASFITLSLVLPPFSYLMIPHYQFRYRRDEISRVEFDHEYFGAI